MQIVIDVPNEEVPNKQEIIDVSLHFIESEVCECTYPYIVLPKGHGRLIDADAVLVDPFGNTYKDIDIAETIIEADKAESEVEE